MKERKKRKISLLLCIGLLMMSVLFLNETSVQASAKKPSKIVLNVKNTTTSAGCQLKLKVASVKPSKASKQVTWSSSNKKIATVSQKGVVKAKKKGSVTITAKSKVNKKVSAKCKIKVYAATKELKLTCQNAYTLYPGDTATASAKVTRPAKGYEPVKWSSKDSKIATVTNKGEITAIAPGTTVITGKSGKKSVKINITVNSRTIEVNSEDSLYAEYLVSGLTISYQQGDYADSVMNDLILPAVVTEEEESIPVLWKSSNPAVISNTGAVTRPENTDVSVIMTAVVVKGNASAEKNFSLKVIHKSNRNQADLPDHSIADIAEMNEGDDIKISLSDDQTQVVSIKGKYGDIPVRNADDALDVIQSNRTALGLENAREELENYSRNSDEYGAQYTFMQKKNGYNVYGHNITVSADSDGRTDFLNADLYPTEKLESVNTVPSVTQSAAENMAVSQYGGNCKADSDKTELVIYTLDEYADHPAMVYIVIVSGTDKTGQYVSEKVYVDAVTGNIISTFSQIDNLKQTTGEGIAESGRTVSFPIAISASGRYYYNMRSMDRGIQMFSGETGLPIGNDTNVWTDSTAVSAYTNMIKVCDWYWDKFERNSYDNNWSVLKVVVHGIETDKNGDRITNNAYWNNNAGKITFYNNSSEKPVTPTTANALDVAGHEFTHGIVRSMISKNVDISKAHNYLGSINEGYADVFGCLIDGDWELGEDWELQRSAADPKSKKCADRLNGAYYKDPENTAYAPLDIAYSNCTLLSHAAYLMKESGMSDDDLANLWYKSLGMGYGYKSNFHTVRTFVLQAAKQLDFSDGQIAAIKKAFDEEEIYDLDENKKFGFLNVSVKNTDGVPIPNAFVLVKKDGMLIDRKLTNKYGELALMLDVDTYEVTATVNGYIDSSITKSIPSVGAESCHFILEKAVNQPEEERVTLSGYIGGMGFDYDTKPQDVYLADSIKVIARCDETKKVFITTTSSDSESGRLNYNLSLEKGHEYTVSFEGYIGSRMGQLRHRETVNITDDTILSILVQTKNVPGMSEADKYKNEYLELYPNHVKVTNMNENATLDESKSLQTTTMYLLPGETAQIAITMAESGYTCYYSGVTYESDDENVAKVNESGLVEAVAPGETIVTCKINNTSAKCSVIVSE